jgi:hypothetical protein
MDQNTTTPQTAEVETTDTGYSEAGAVQALLSKWAKDDEQPAASEAPATEEQPQAPAADASESEGQSAEPATEEADFELDVGGKKFKFPKAIEEPLRAVSATVKEIEAGATRKFQEAADLRKATETERAAVAEMRKIAEAHADLLADHRSIARRMQQLENVDIDSTDADTLARYNAEYTRLTAASKRIEAAYAEGVKTLRTKEAEALRARQEHAERVVAQRIKGWGPEMQKELAEYAVGRGAPVAALNAISEPWMVEILADAAYGRKMRDHKATTEKRVAQTPPPTLKPGASTGQPRAEFQAREAMQRLGKTHSVNDAAMALLARAQAKRK